MAGLLTMKSAMIVATASLWLSCGVSVAAASEQTILPGYWESVNTSQLLTKKVTSDKRCITATQVNNFLTTPNHHYHCNYTTRVVADGHIRLQGKCVDKHGTSVDLDAEGEYSPEKFHLVAKASLGGLPIEATASTDAHRISEVCPAGAPGPRE